MCICCAALSGTNPPPGGILYENDCWAVYLHAAPLLHPGQAFVVLKRHCERLAELTEAEQAALGPVLHRLARAYEQVFRAEKVHYGLYGEEVRHLHLHALPRTAALPPSNIRLVLRQLRRRLGQRLGLGLSKSFSPAEVAALAPALRAALGGAFAER